MAIKPVDAMIKLINQILEQDTLTANQQIEMLNVLESENKQRWFIKTHKCKCGEVDVELWQMVYKKP